MALVTTEVARRHLKRRPAGSPLTDDDSDIDLKLTQAEAVILAYIARPTDVDWTAEIASWDATGAPAVVPAVIQAAVLMQLAHLYAHRGDEGGAQHGSVAPEAEQLLKGTGYKDPVLA